MKQKETKLEITKKNTFLKNLLETKTDVILIQYFFQNYVFF